MKIENVIKSKINVNLPTIIRQMLVLLIAPLFTLSMVLIPLGVAYAVGTITAPKEAVVTPLKDAVVTRLKGKGDAVKGKGDAVKWHPGHYYTLMSWGKDDPQYLAEIYDELKETPALRGVTIRYIWKELEPREGVYDFTSIEHRLAELAAQKKRLVILLQTKSYLPQTDLVPDYIKTKKYEGGIFAFQNYHSGIRVGDNIKLWNPLVRDRMIALVRALGKQFNSEPYFEGIGLTETAFGQPLIRVSEAKRQDHYHNLLSINQQMRNHFPNTMTFQFTNYPRPILESFVGKLSKMGTALGVPDVWLDDPGMTMRGPYTPDGIYHYFPDFSGIVPLTPQVEHINYISSRRDGKGYAPSIPELLDFARNQLKANYIFWTRTPGYYPEVLEMLNWSSQRSDPAGGLDQTCPSAYSACIKW